jgi:hypothetical protein
MEWIYYQDRQGRLTTIFAAKFFGYYNMILNDERTVAVWKFKRLNSEPKAEECDASKAK